jgi:hypothetical protein
VPPPGPPFATGGRNNFPSQRLFLICQSVSTVLSVIAPRRLHVLSALLTMYCSDRWEAAGSGAGRSMAGGSGGAGSNSSGSLFSSDSDVTITSPSSTPTPGFSNWPALGCLSLDSLLRRIFAVNHHVTETVTSKSRVNIHSSLSHQRRRNPLFCRYSSPLSVFRRPCS